MFVFCMYRISLMMLITNTCRRKRVMCKTSSRTFSNRLRHLLRFPFSHRRLPASLASVLKLSTERQRRESKLWICADINPAVLWFTMREVISLQVGQGTNKWSTQCVNVWVCYSPWSLSGSISRVFPNVCPREWEREGKRGRKKEKETEREKATKNFE